MRVDSGVRSGDEISGLYDPLIAKLIVHDVDREHARRRMLRALEEFVIDGPDEPSGIPPRAARDAVLRLRRHVQRRGGVRGACPSRRRSSRSSVGRRSGGVATGTDGREQLVSVEIDGRRHEVRIHAPEPPWAEVARRHKERSKGIAGNATGAVASPMQGTVLSVAVAVGSEIQAGELICVVEAMKMENELVAHRDGVVAELHVAPGQQVALGDVVCVIDAP